MRLIGFQATAVTYEANAGTKLIPTHLFIPALVRDIAMGMLGDNGRGMRAVDHYSWLWFVCLFNSTFVSIYLSIGCDYRRVERSETDASLIRYTVQSKSGTLQTGLCQFYSRPSGYSCKSCPTPKRNDSFVVIFFLFFGVKIHPILNHLPLFIPYSLTSSHSLNSTQSRFIHSFTYSPTYALPTVSATW